ncbi:MAG: DNA-3-methyladenine glycosylase family protein [Halobacteriota archaeon]
MRSLVNRSESGSSVRYIEPTPPFDFTLSAQIFADGDPQIAYFDGKKYRRVLRVYDSLILAIVESMGSINDPQLRVRFASNYALSDRDLNTATALISSVFNTQLDVSPFYQSVRENRVMADLTHKLRGLKNPMTTMVFEALFDSIIEQQISLAVAHVLERRVIKALGNELFVNDQRYYAYPTPERLALASVDSLRNCGLSRRKAEYITEIAKRIVAQELDLEGLRQCADTNEVLNRLCALRGIGIWTAELTALRGLNRLDVIPADDLGLRRWIAHYYCNGRRITSAEARRLAELWGDWKGLAGYYLIVAGLLKIPALQEIKLD